MHGLYYDDGDLIVKPGENILDPGRGRQKNRKKKECFLIDVSRFGFDSSTASIVVTTPVWMIKFSLYFSLV